MGKMARHVSQIGCTMGETIKNVFFRAFFEGQKNKKTRPQELKSVHELIEHPLRYDYATHTKCFTVI